MFKEIIKYTSIIMESMLEVNKVYNKFNGVNIFKW